MRQKRSIHRRSFPNGTFGRMVRLLTSNNLRICVRIRLLVDSGDGGGGGGISIDDDCAFILVDSCSTDDACECGDLLKDDSGGETI